MNELGKHLDGKTQRLKNPHKPYTLKWAAWIIGVVGGWRPHSKDIDKRPAGLTTLRRGLERFEYFNMGWWMAIETVLKQIVTDNEDTTIINILFKNCKNCDISKFYPKKFLYGE